jgi:hypothetical protein
MVCLILEEIMPATERQAKVRGVYSFSLFPEIVKSLGTIITSLASRQRQRPEILVNHARAGGFPLIQLGPIVKLKG